MKLLKRHGDTSTIRMVETDDGMLLGYIGQVRDLMAEKWVREKTGKTIDDIEQATWLYIARDRRVHRNGIREGVLAMARWDEIIKKGTDKERGAEEGSARQNG